MRDTRPPRLDCCGWLPGPPQGKTCARGRLESDQVRAGSLAKDGLEAEGNEMNSHDDDAYLDKSKKARPPSATAN